MKLSTRFVKVLAKRYLDDCGFKVDSKDFKVIEGIKNETLSGKLITYTIKWHGMILKLRSYEDKTRLVDIVSNR